jgi:hypothetical protein
VVGRRESESESERERERESLSLFYKTTQKESCCCRLHNVSE